MNEDEVPPDFYPQFLTMMASIRKSIEEGLTWDEIEDMVSRDLVNNAGRQYIIYHGQLCGHPSKCTKTAVVCFIYPYGPIFGCVDHAIPTMEEFVQFMREHHG